MLLASQRKRPGLLLNILRQTRQTPPQKMTHPQVSIVLKLRNSDLELKASVKKEGNGTSLAVQWLRICLPVQGTQEVSPCCGATKLLSLHTQEPVCCNKSLR